MESAGGTGPKSRRDAAAVDGDPLAEMPYYSFYKGNMGGVSDISISATGYTGAGGFGLYVKNQQAAGLWKKIRDRCSASWSGRSGHPAVRKGFCLYGNDLSDTTSPLEAGLDGSPNSRRTLFRKSSCLNKKKAA